MNQAHVHLIVTHLPIFGSVLGALVLFYGWVKRSNQTLVAAYGVLVLAAIGGGVAYFTGEGAEEIAEHIPGVTEQVIEEHEDMAQITLASLIVLGTASLIGVFLIFRRSVLVNAAAVTVLLIALVSFGLAARTGYLGGQIRHTEINTAGAGQLPGVGEQGHDDD